MQQIFPLFVQLTSLLYMYTIFLKKYSYGAFLEILHTSDLIFLERREYLTIDYIVLLFSTIWFPSIIFDT